MKKFILMSALVMGGLGLKTADAQFGIRINLHLGNPAPVIVNEPIYDDYYYLPEVEAYYSVGEHSYYYQDGNRWISAAYLPGRYHDFDWRSAKHYEIRGNRPYMQHDVYRGKFGGYYNRNDYYARAYPGRDRFDNDRNHPQYGNRDWNENRGGNDRRGGRNDYNQPRNQGGYNQQGPGRNQGGGYSQPSQNQGGYNQQTPGRNQGGNYGQPNQNQGGNQQQPSQPQGQQGGGRGNGQGRGGDNNSQPSNNQGGQGRGNYTGGEHLTVNKVGLAPDRGDFVRPVRN